MTDLRVVSAYRKMKPESGHHQRLGAFDWDAALAFLAASVRRSCDCETRALSDTTTHIRAVPAFRFPTVEPRLMLWILEVSLAYLQSPDFDRDSVFVSPDTLIVGNLRPYFAGDLTLLVRSSPKYRNRPILNAVQWWPVASKAQLIHFYRVVLEVARGLPDNVLKWGADSESIRQVIAPIQPGVHFRAGLQVSMVESRSVLFSISNLIVRQIEQQQRVLAPHQIPIIDFKGPRKLWLQRYAGAIGWAPCT